MSSASLYLPRAASAYFLALVCFAPSEIYFAALYIRVKCLSPSFSYTSANQALSKAPSFSSFTDSGVYLAIMAVLLLSNDSFMCAMK